MNETLSPSWGRYAPSRILWQLSRRLKDFVAPPHRYLKKCRSIIHVGANDGAERDTYSEYSLSVLWIEALPEVFEKLKENLRVYPKQSAVRALVTDVEGDLHTFNVSSHGGQSSSIFDFGKHGELWPDIEFTGSVALTSTTLDRVLQQNNRLASEFDALIMDVQGAELLVLKGAGEVLDNVRFIQAEAADFPAYVGGSTLETLSSFLKEKGFRLRHKSSFAWKKGVGAYYNVLYERGA